MLIWAINERSKIVFEEMPEMSDILWWLLVFALISYQRNTNFTLNTLALPHTSFITIKLQIICSVHRCEY